MYAPIMAASSANLQWGRGDRSRLRAGGLPRRFQAKRTKNKKGARKMLGIRILGDWVAGC
jgi:hypothetical protein